MGFDPISSAPLTALSTKDFAKKKRTNRLAKLKQSKLDVRREQWLSQVKNKGCKMDSIGKGESQQSQIKTAAKQKSLDGLECSPREDTGSGSSSIHDSDMDSLTSSPIGSILDHSDCSKGHSGNSSSTSSGYCSGSVTEEEEEDDGCLDNWETIADALTAKENEQSPVPNSPPSLKYENIVALSDPKPSNTVSDSPKTDITELVSGSDANRRAWRSDDTFRPQTLPNLMKQRSFETNSNRQCSHGPINRAWKTVMSQPSSCPICCEDLDVTDTSFLPCSCGFRLCLFCHKRILEADARCPGCRKHYDPLNGNGNTGLSHFCIVRSFSMSS